MYLFNENVQHESIHILRICGINLYKHGEFSELGNL
jgi:hypothetical protein